MRLDCSGDLKPRRMSALKRAGSRFRLSTAGAPKGQGISGSARARLGRSEGPAWQIQSEIDGAKPMIGGQERQGYRKPMKSTGATVPLLFKTPRKPLQTRESFALFHVRGHHARPRLGSD